MFCLAVFSSSYDYENVQMFWHSAEMGGMFVSGTIMIFANRAITFGLLVWVPSKIAPSNNVLLAKILSIAIGIIIIILYIYSMFISKTLINFSVLYKNTIDLIAMSLGLLLGYIATKEAIKA